MPEAGIAAKEAPISDVWRNGRRGLVRVFFMNVDANAHSYIFQVLLGSYLITYLDVDSDFVPMLLLVGALFACASAITAGSLTDRLGRKPVALFGTGFLLVFPVPALLLLNTRNDFLIGLVLVLGFIFAAQGTVGVQGVFFTQLFGARYRYAGVALGREFSGVVGGGISPVVCSALITWAAGTGGRGRCT